MRELIVMDIKAFIEILRERGVTIDTQFVINQRKKKIKVQPIKQAVDNSYNLIDADLLETQHIFSDTIYQQQDCVRETDYLFTANDVSVSVINSLIHVSIQQTM